MDDQAIEQGPAEDRRLRWRQEREEFREHWQQQERECRERNRQLANAVFRQLRRAQDRNRELAELIVAAVSALVEANMWATASEAFGPRLVADLNEVMRAAGWVWEAPREVA